MIESFFILASPHNFSEMSVEFIKPHKEGLRLKFENINDRNASEKLAGVELYLREDFFISEEGESLYLAEIEGFTFIDLISGFEGVICGFSYNGAQDLLQVRSLDQREETQNMIYDIPFVEAFIKNIDYENKKVVSELPEGLLEINLTDKKSESL